MSRTTTIVRQLIAQLTQDLFIIAVITTIVGGATLFDEQHQLLAKQADLDKKLAAANARIATRCRPAQVRP